MCSLFLITGMVGAGLAQVLIVPESVPQLGLHGVAALLLRVGDVPTIRGAARLAVVEEPLLLEAGRVTLTAPLDC